MNTKSFAAFGTMNNIDFNHYRRFYLYTQGNITAENVREQLAHYFENNLLDSISDYLINICAQVSCVPSKYWYSLEDRYQMSEENGVPVNFKEDYDVKGYHIVHEQLGIDLVAEFLNYLKKNGKRTWFTFRLNDCHHNDDTPSWIHSKMFFPAKKNGWIVGEDYGYFHTCFNFSVREIREYTLNYIIEQINAYDVDGIDFDFQREMICFDFLHDKSNYVEVMNDFVRSVKKAVVDAEKKWGHAISVNIRLSPIEDNNKMLGFDAVQWAKEGLMDSLTVSSRFWGTDTDMPIADWKKKLSPYGVKIFAGLELQCIPRVRHDIASYAALAAKYYEAGADKIYLFNDFFYFDSEYIKTDTYTMSHLVCSSLENAKAHARRFVGCHDDSLVARGADGKPVMARVGDIPVEISVKGKEEYILPTGSFSDNTKATLYLGVLGDAPAVTVNGAKAVLIENDDNVLCKDFVAAFKVPCKLYTYFVNTDASSFAQKLVLEGNCTVNYIDWLVKK